jgi:hypothetical protein
MQMLKNEALSHASGIGDNEAVRQLPNLLLPSYPNKPVMLSCTNFAFVIRL